MSSKKADDKKTVLVVGAGSGATAARELSKKLDPSKYDIVLVNPVPFAALLPATIRMAVTKEENLESHDKGFIPLDRLFAPGKAGRIVIGHVTSIVKNDKAGGEAVLQSGERIPYDVLLLAPGSKWTGPIAFPWFEGEDAVLKFINEQRSQFAAAKDVVIVGGGAIGIEMSGEIKDFYPKTNVTIVHGNKALLNDAYPDKLKRALESRLKSRGVKLIYGDYVDDFPEGTYDHVTTRGGKKLKADLVLSARGLTPNTDFLSTSPLSSAITSSRTIRIEPTFQVAGHPDIFAIGDIIEWKEQKQAAKAAAHAAIAANNIAAYLTNGGNGMKQYKGSNEMILVTLGRSGGVAYLSFGWFSLVFGDWFARMMKSRQLLTNMIRPNYGY